MFCVQDRGNDHILLLWDTYGSHMTRATRTFCADNKIDLIFVPGKCTPYCQPMDVGVNNVFKQRHRTLIELWIKQHLLAQKSNTIVLNHFTNDVFVAMIYKALANIKRSTVRSAFIDAIMNGIKFNTRYNRIK